MNKRLMNVLLAGGLAVFGLAACGGDKKEEGTTTPPADTDNNTSETVAKGESVTQSSCIGCHGNDLTGGMGPNLHGLTLSKDEIVEIVTNGKGQMPGGLAKGDEEAVADYLLTLK